MMIYENKIILYFRIYMNISETLILRNIAILTK